MIYKNIIQKEKHRHRFALIKGSLMIKKQALSEIDIVKIKVEIEKIVYTIFAETDAVVTKFKKGLTLRTHQKNQDKKTSPPKPGMQPSPQPEVKPQRWKNQNQRLNRS